MGNVTVNGRDGTDVINATHMLRMFMGEAMVDAQQFEKRLIENPMSLEEIEREVGALFNRGQGLFVAGLIAKAMAAPSFQRQAEELRDEYAIDLKKGANRQIQLRLAGGFSCHATTYYCPPKRNNTDDASVPGLDIELSQFGFSGGDSPGLVSKVARSTALNPSLELACKELKRDGIVLDKSIVDRISSRAAQELLTLRERDLEAFGDGELEQLDELAGHSISVQIDGGRTRTRVPGIRLDTLENFAKSQSEATGRESMGRSKEKRRRATFEALWREPKVMIIYVHDRNGRLDKKYRTTIDGTFGDVTQMSEIIAMHLHRLGAARAASICFNSDGAAWIWDRIDSILKMAKIPTSVTIHRVLDVYHACENLHKGIDALPLDPVDRKTLFRTLRTKLRDGHWEAVAMDLETRLSSQLADGEKLSPDDASCKEVRRVINYLRNHGERGHLYYPMFKCLGLPLGSGSIESAIRRVVNLRMKGNGIFWRLGRAEEMLMLRATILSDRWDDNRQRAKESLKRNARLSMPSYLVPKPDAQKQTTKTLANP